MRSAVEKMRGSGHRRCSHATASVATVSEHLELEAVETSTLFPETTLYLENNIKSSPLSFPQISPMVTMCAAALLGYKMHNLLKHLKASWRHRDTLETKAFLT